MRSVETKHIKIIYLVGGPLTKRWLSYYCVDEMATVFDVEFWDIAAILPDGYNVSSIEERPYARTILSLNDLRQNLKRLPKDTLLVNEIGLVPNHYEVLKLVSSYISNSIVIDFWTYFMWDVVDKKGSAQQTSNPKILKTRIYQYDFIWHIAKLCHCRSVNDIKKLNEGFKKRKNDRENAIIEARCKSLFKIYEMTYKPFHKYTINHPDYEKYLQVRSQKERTDKYIVFIADAYPYHPEITLLPGYNADDIAKLYYASLNRFFDIIENIYECKVVIAEHPSMHWKDNPFDGREVVYYKTAELVRDSYAVCMHASCAFSFVALFDKPVAILYNNAIDANSSIKADIHRMARAIQHKVIDTDTMGENMTNIFLPIDKRLRLQYLQTFADADCSTPNKELMKRHFINIHNEIINNLS